MVDYCTDKKQIIRLWQQAFGDSDEEILYFIDNVKDAKCLAYFVGSEAVSMMYLVDCIADGINASYIYAACTLDKYKGRGYMSKLIEHCIDGGSTVCLIPAEDSLINFYSSRFISRKIAIESIEFEQTPEILEYLFEGYNLSSPTALISEE